MSVENLTAKDETEEICNIWGEHNKEKTRAYFTLRESVGDEERKIGQDVQNVYALF